MVTDAERRPAQRRDAQRNRQRILDAAREVFGEQGLGAPLVEITRRAGVGDGTFYRHFPSRTDLHTALYDEARESIGRVGEQALLIEDGWLALTRYFENACEFTAANRAIGELMAVMMSDPAAREAQWEHGNKVMGELLERAQRQGLVHREVALGDVLSALNAVLVLIPASEGVAPEMWRRQLAFTLNGFRPHDGLTVPPTPPVTTAQHLEIVTRLFLRRQ